MFYPVIIALKFKDNKDERLLCIHHFHAFISMCDKHTLKFSLLLIKLKKKRKRREERRKEEATSKLFTTVSTEI